MHRIDWTDLDPELTRLYLADTPWDDLEEIIGVSEPILKKRVKTLGLPPLGKGWRKKDKRAA